MPLIGRVGQNHIFICIYGVHTVFIAKKSPYIRSCTVFIYSYGQPYFLGSCNGVFISQAHYSLSKTKPHQFPFVWLKVVKRYVWNTSAQKECVWGPGCEWGAGFVPFPAKRWVCPCMDESDRNAILGQISPLPGSGFKPYQWKKNEMKENERKKGVKSLPPRDLVCGSVCWPKWCISETPRRMLSGHQLSVRIPSVCSPGTPCRVIWFEMPRVSFGGHRHQKPVLSSPI